MVACTGFGVLSRVLAHLLTTLHGSLRRRNSCLSCGALAPRRHLVRTGAIGIRRVLEPLYRLTADTLPANSVEERSKHCSSVPPGATWHHCCVFACLVTIDDAAVGVNL